MTVPENTFAFITDVAGCVTNNGVVGPGKIPGRADPTVLPDTIPERDTKPPRNSAGVNVAAAFDPAANP